MSDDSIDIAISGRRGEIVELWEYHDNITCDGVVIGVSKERWEKYEDAKRFCDDFEDWALTQ